MRAVTQSVSYKWYVVVLLLLIYLLSYFDRYILSLVIGPLKQSMHLSDFQIGLLLGPAFSLFNIIVIIPLGWYADRSRRTLLIIIGILCWCSMTSAMALVVSFIPLLFFRLGVGLGEAVLLPSSISLISDYFDRSSRSRPISVYMAGTYLGAGLAFLVGGHLVGWLQSMGSFHLLGFGPFLPWQAAFLLVGMPGALFAILMLTVREPARTDTLSERPHGAAPKQTFEFMRAHWKGFAALFLGSSCNVAVSIMALWNVPLFERLWHWNVTQAGSVTGLYFLTAGPLGTALAVVAIRALNKKREDGAMRMLVCGLMINVPMSILYPIMPNATLAIIAMFVAFVGTSVATASGPAALSLITPGEMRAQAFAIYTSMVTLLGTLIAPPLIGFAVDWTGDPRKIGVVLSGFALAVGLPTLILIFLGFRRYGEALEEMNEISRTRSVLQNG